MPPKHTPPQSSPQARALLGMNSFSVLYAFLYCMLASGALGAAPVMGGALFMLGRVATMLARQISRKKTRALPKALRRTGAVILLALLPISLALLLLYPLAAPAPLFWLLACLALLITWRGTLTRRLFLWCRARALSYAQTNLRLTLLSAALCVPLALALFFSLDATRAAYLMGGYVLSAALECYGLWTEGEPPHTDERDEPEDLTALRGAHAYRVFQYVLCIAAAALQVTIVMAYAYIGATATGVLYCMAIALVCTFAAREMATWVLKKTLTRDPDPGNVLIFGLAAWLLGLLVFARNLSLSDEWAAYLSLAMCSIGGTISAVALSRLSRDMRRVAEFTTGRVPGARYEEAQHAAVEFSSLAGQALALIGLALWGLLAGSGETLVAQPPLLLPACLLVLAAFLAALRFPMTKRHLEKLRRFLQLRERGEKNAPLEKELEGVVVQKSKRRYVVKIIIALIRPFYYHKILGRENVRLDDDIAAIFVCNHGELYGPVVTNLYVPYSFRPWVISELMEPAEVSDYIYQFTILRQRWLPSRWKRPLADALTPAIIRVMRSLESIPVYRDRPRELIRTFKTTAQAMQAGDNILLFPENPHAANQEKEGYLRDGIGEFSTGFVMIAQVYYDLTGKRAQFIPIYADKERRTLTFGHATRYDPEPPPVPEKERIVEHLRGEMLRLGKFAG